MLCEEHRAGPHAVNHDRAQKQGGCGVAGNAQGQQGHQGTAGNRIVGGLGGRNADSIACPKDSGSLDSFFLHIVSHKRSHVGSRAGDDPDYGSDNGAANPGGKLMEHSFQPIHTLSTSGMAALVLARLHASAVLNTDTTPKRPIREPPGRYR